MAEHKTKKIVILWNNGGRLANQLWVFAYLYAYALEKNIKLENYSFFEYDEYFSFPVNNCAVKILFFKPFNFFKKILPSCLRRYLIFVFRIYYGFFFKIIKKIKESEVYINKKETILAPSAQESPCIFKKLEEGVVNEVYVGSWDFTNRVGLEKYQKEISVYFSPKEKYVEQSSKYISKIKKNFDFVVGVHIRHGDYKKWEGGKYYFSFLEVRKILDDYLASRKDRSTKKYFFMICSDEKIDEDFFKGLSYATCLGTEIGDLLCLSMADVIIGSRSTYGSWAAYYGGIPFFIFSHSKMNWDKPDNGKII